MRYGKYKKQNYEIDHCSVGLFQKQINCGKNKQTHIKVVRIEENYSGLAVEDQEKRKKKDGRNLSRETSTKTKDTEIMMGIRKVGCV